MHTCAQHEIDSWWKSARVIVATPWRVEFPCGVVRSVLVSVRIVPDITPPLVVSHDQDHIRRGVGCHRTHRHQEHWCKLRERMK